MAADVSCLFIPVSYLYIFLGEVSVKALPVFKLALLLWKSSWPLNSVWVRGTDPCAVKNPIIYCILTIK